MVHIVFHFLFQNLPHYIPFARKNIKIIDLPVMIYVFFVWEKMNFVFAEIKISFAETLNHTVLGRIRE
ncbi:hypothetical protein DRQ33_03135 [bacterium]|nr:MAG: hypothetical protein DRQ33_03135 [bacterium]